MRLSPETVDRINTFRKPEVLYRPNDTVQKHIGTRSLKITVGPSQVGKMSVGESTAHLNSSYGMATTLTTREPRPYDKPGRHRFLEHNDENINMLLDKILSGELVNYKFHPTTDKFYGSEIEDFPYENNMMAVLSGAIDQFQSAGFRDTAVFGLVAPPADWMKRINAHYPIKHPERSQRISEAEICYNDLLLRSDVHWIINPEGDPLAAAKQIVHSGEALPEDQSVPVALAQRVLQIIEDEKMRAFGEKYE